MIINNLHFWSNRRLIFSFISAKFKIFIKYVQNKVENFYLQDEKGRCLSAEAINSEMLSYDGEALRFIDAGTRLFSCHESHPTINPLKSLFAADSHPVF